MARPYSNDLRERAALAVASGRSCPEVAILFAGECCERGEVVAAPAGDRDGGDAANGRPSQAAARTAPGAGDRPGSGRYRTSRSRRWWRNWPSGGSRPARYRCGGWCARKGRASKKTPFAVEQLRPKVARRRAQWKKYQGRLDPRRLVFIDETWAKTKHDADPGLGAAGAKAGCPRAVWPLAQSPGAR